MNKPIWEWWHKQREDQRTITLGNGSFPADDLAEAIQILLDRLSISPELIQDDAGSKPWFGWYKIGDNECYLEKNLCDHPNTLNWEHVWLNLCRPSLQFQPYINRLIRAVESHEFGREFLKRFPMTKITPTMDEILQWAEERDYSIDVNSPITLVRGIEFAKAYSAREMD